MTKAPIGRPRVGERRSVVVSCDRCGTSFRRKLSQLRKSISATCSRDCANIMRKGGQERRFWSHVDRSPGPDACWPWLAARNRSGYGRFATGYKMVFAHRMALRLVGVEVPDDSVVMHSCDHPWCVNPGHLRVGSWSDNVRDMVAKGRNPDRKGARHPLAKLSDNDVRLIRQLAEERSDAALSSEFGVSQAQIYRIRTAKNWGHIDGR